MSLDEYEEMKTNRQNNFDRSRNESASSVPASISEEAAPMESIKEDGGGAAEGGEEEAGGGKKKKKSKKDKGGGDSESDRGGEVKKKSKLFGKKDKKDK